MQMGNLRPSRSLFVYPIRNVEIESFMKLRSKLLGVHRIWLGSGFLSFGLLGLSSCALLGLDWERTPTEDPITRAIHTRDVILGMNTDEVANSWGEPVKVVRSGTDNSGRERWVYVDGLSAPGFRSLAEKRVIYFENGEVVGWETMR